MTHYAELHARSAFSFLEGASVPEDLAARAAELDLPAVALLDRDGVYGAPRFHLAAKKLGIRAHIGAEITGPGGARYPMLVETREGYRNLCRLVTKMKMRARKGEGEATEEELAEHSAGLICLTGGEQGLLGRALDEGFDAGVKAVEKLVTLFGRRSVYAEIERHHIRSEEARNDAVRTIAARLGSPVVATGGVRYAIPERRKVLDVLTCVRAKVPISRAGRLLERNSNRFLRSGRQMSRLFADIPEAIGNAAELSARLDFTLSELGYEFPRYPSPPGETMMSYLSKLADAGARRRYDPYHERARLQIERELALICKLDLAGYFLIVWDIVDFCRRRGILVQGRGSAANSAVCYALGITAV